MTDKFIPFNPETAKNGDTVYVYKRKPYTYIGKDAYNKNASVIQNEDGYGWDYNNDLTVKAPKKTVWVNIYNGLNGDDVGYYYNTKEEAIKASSPKERSYIGTYPLEIDDVA